MRFRNSFLTRYWLPFVLLFCGLVSLSPVPHPGVNAFDEKSQSKEETWRREDGLGPNELFFYDHNYPDYNLHYDTYQRRLNASIAYDQHSQSGRRGLDYPWTLEGPGNIGGRVNTIAVNPADPEIMFIGYSQGGIYRTADGGQTWTPVFDDQTSLSISDIEFDPSTPSHVWATTGDVNISGYYFIGAGIFESTDSGITWTYKGLKEAGVLSKLAIDNEPNHLYVGSMGFPAYKGTERGIYRSVNGGMTWEKTLTIDDSTGIIDIVADRTQAGRVYATAWTRLRSNTVSTTLGPGTGVYRSDDFGATWVNVKNGLPEGLHSRTCIEMTNQGTLFVSYSGPVDNGYCAGSKEELINIYKSTDTGLSWDTIPTAPIFNLPCDLLGGFGWYFDMLKVNPEDPDDIFILGVDLFRSQDGGFYWTQAAPPWWDYQVHADKHVLTFSQGQLFLGTDGGAYKSTLENTSVWEDIENIPSTQFYRTAWNPHHPDLYYGGAQDNGTTGGNESTFNEWPRILGGDGFQPLFDPEEPDWSFALTQYGDVWFSDNGGVDFSRLTHGLNGTRFWDMPIIVSPFDPKILFCGANRVFKINMNDSARTWNPISPDLTKGILVLGNRYPALTALTQSPVDEMRLYAGTQDGLIWTSGDGGENWEDISAGTPGAFVTSMACSTVDSLGVIATFSGYRDNDFQPYIFRSHDAGMHWESLASDMPMMAVNNLFILPGTADSLLIIGTDGGVYVSFDAGEQWDRVGSNMPYFPVYDIDYDPVGNKIIAATFARGIMTFPMDELELETGNKEPFGTFYNLVRVYPTLATDFVNIEIRDAGQINWPLRVSLSSLNGGVVKSENFLKSTVIHFEFNHPLTPGMYLVTMESGKGVSTQPIIIQ